MVMAVGVILLLLFKLLFRNDYTVAKSVHTSLS